ncbi:MAG: FG-GAP repeat protein, partial [Planctomycetes bacterium]|nr:FG-GAP repeat protein [Planctomycetota bacterium]
MRIHHTNPRKRLSQLVALLCLTVSAAEVSGQCDVTPIPVGDGSTGGFSSAVDLDGDIAVMGDSDDEPFGPESGSVKVRRFNGTVWVEEAILTASNGAAEDSFGNRVAVSGNVIAI